MKVTMEQFRKAKRVMLENGMKTSELEVIIPYFPKKIILFGQTFYRVKGNKNKKIGSVDGIDIYWSKECSSKQIYIIDKNYTRVYPDMF